MGSVNTTYSGWKIAQGISLLATLACIGIALGVIFSQGGISYALDRGRNFTYLMGGLTGLSLIALFVTTLGRECSTPVIEKQQPTKEVTTTTTTVAKTQAAKKVSTNTGIPTAEDYKDPEEGVCDEAEVLKIGRELLHTAKQFQFPHGKLMRSYLSFFHWAQCWGKKSELDVFWKEISELQEKSPKYQAFLKKLKWCNRKAQFFIKKGISIKWATGTKANTLIGIEEVAKAAFTNHHHALVPTGQLLPNNVVPIAGEMREGIQEMNHQHLSGTGGRDIGLAIEFAEQQGYAFDIDREKDYIRRYDLKNNNYFPLRLKAAILRLVHYGNLTPQEKEELKSTLTKNTNADFASPYLKVFDTPPKNLSASQRKLLNPQENYPIVWASSKELDTYDIDGPVGLAFDFKGIRGELLFRGQLRIGHDLDLVFAPKSKRAHLRAWLKEQGLQDKVTVTSFAVARYLGFRSS